MYSVIPITPALTLMQLCLLVSLFRTSGFKTYVALYKYVFYVICLTTTLNTCAVKSVYKTIVAYKACGLQCFVYSAPGPWWGSILYIPKNIKYSFLQ